MPQFIYIPLTCRGNQISWQDEAMLSIDFIFGGAVYMTNMIPVVYIHYWGLKKIWKDLYLQLYLSQKARWTISLHEHKTSKSPTKSMETHLLHLILGAVNYSSRVGELEAVAEFLELFFQDIHMLVTVLHPVTTHLLQSLQTDRHDSWELEGVWVCLWLQMIVIPAWTNHVSSAV